MLEFEDISIGYKELLFKVPNMKLDLGQLIVLIGPNGSGKTTFLQTILGLKEPFSGVVRCNGVPSGQLSRANKVKFFSHVASKFEGVNHLTVFDLVAMGRAPFTNMLNVLTREDKHIVNEIISDLSLDKIAFKNTLEISDGERQIAMIGKALAQETQLIVLDEPTAFLDYNNRRKTLRLLKEIAQKKEKLIVLTSHDLELSFECSHLILGVDEKSKSLKTYDAGVAKEHIIQEIFGDK